MRGRPLGLHSAFNLSLVGERIEHCADIVRGREFLERYLTGCWINFDFGYLGAERGYINGVFGYIFSGIA